jgi:hypothetical protein
VVGEKGESETMETVETVKTVETVEFLWPLAALKQDLPSFRPPARP